MPHTVVIGAGVAGLATAGLLAREGHQVTVLERGETWGGRAGLLEDAGFRFDTGPSWYLMPEVFDHFYAMMGTSTAAQLELKDLTPGYRLLTEPPGAQPSQSEPQPGVPATNQPSTPVDVHSGLTEACALAEQLEPGSSPALRTYLESAQRTYRMALERFLYNPFSNYTTLAHPQVLRRLPELARLLGESLQHYVQRRFTSTALRQILQYPAVFLATHPAAAPSMYHLMSHMDLTDGVRYPMGGFTAVVDSMGELAQRNGVQFTYGAEVTQILTEPTPRRGAGSPGAGLRSPRWRRGARRRATGVIWQDAAGAQHQIDADYVVSAADLHHTETQLLAAEDRSVSARSWDRAVSGPGAVLVMLGIRGDLPELAHHSLLFAEDWSPQFEAIFGDSPATATFGTDGNPLSIYVCRPSATDPQTAPPGHQNLFILVPCPADPNIGSGGTAGAGDQQVEAIADAAVDQLAAWAGVPDLRERIVTRHTLGPGDFAQKYHSWSGGALGPAHTLGQSAMFRTQNASRRVDGLFYAGGTVAPGVGVPMCLISAELVLKHIRGDHSPGPLTPRPARSTDEPLSRGRSA